MDKSLKRLFSHIIVVGVDGAGAFIKKADTPKFDRIFKSGAVTYDALSSKPSISAECWGSMLLGVGPEIHRLTNSIVESTPYPVDSENPSVFRRIREFYPEAELGSYCNWNPITYGIVENNLNVSHATAKDEELTALICEYIKTKKPDFLFIQLDSVDGAGHKNGYGTPAHLNQITEVDKYIGKIHSAAEEAHILNDTLFIVIADHGGTPDGHHGGWTDAEKYVTFAAKGKGISNGQIKEMNIRDLAAIILYSLGINLPDFDENGWTSQIPENLFCEAQLPAYRDISHLTGAAPRVSKIQHTSELV